MRIIRASAGVLACFVSLTAGVKVLDVNRTLGTIILVLAISIPFWIIFFKDRSKKWWALIPAWVLPVEAFFILKLEGTLNELLCTAIIILSALPFTICYIIKRKKFIKKCNIYTHFLSGSLFVVLLPVIYIVELLLVPYSGLARNLAYGGAVVEDMNRFPYRTTVNKSSVFTFTQASGETVSEKSASYHTIVDDTFKSSNYSSFEDFLSESGTTSFLVIQNDDILYEWYGNGYERDSLVTSFSVAKSFVSALIGFAIDDGYISSEDDPITKYIPELLQKDERFSEITIKHLLTMTSGIHYEKDGPPWGDDMLTYYAVDMRKSALSVQIDEAPGKTFKYNNYNPLLLGLIIERTTGKAVTAYLEEKVWSQLGMEYPGSWTIDSEQSGFEKMQVGINARAVDFAKLGRLYLNAGNWNGKQVLSSDWIKKSTQIDKAHDFSDDYKYLWWVNANGYSAKGAFGQYIYVFPKQNMIIVRFGLRNELGDAWEQIFTSIAEASPTSDQARQAEMK